MEQGGARQQCRVTWFSSGVEEGGEGCSRDIPK